jgi:hypothetical protein
MLVMYAATSFVIKQLDVSSRERDNFLVLVDSQNK